MSRRPRENMFSVLQLKYNLTLWNLMLWLLPMSSSGNPTELYTPEFTSGNLIHADSTNGTIDQCDGKFVCIQKCCDYDNMQDCEDSDVAFNITVWRDGVEDIVPVPDDIKVVPREKCRGEKDLSVPADGVIGLDLNDMKMKLKKVNRLPRWEELASNMYCVDSLLPGKGNVCTSADRPDQCPAATTIKIYGMLLSSLLLGLSALVHLCIPRLRNLHGLTIVPYLICLMVAYLSFAILQLTQPLPAHNKTLCVSTTLLAYFCILSSFFWLNVKSYDLYRKFSDPMKTHNPFGRATATFPYRKYYVYCAWGFGLPLAVTILMGTIEFLEHVMPEYVITPKIRHTCFLAGKEQFIWIDIPISILCLANVVLFAITWRAIDRSRFHGDSGTLINRSLSQRKLFFELFLLTGMHWLVEVGSAMLPHPLWLMPDLLNSLIGVPIFFVLIRNKRVKLFIRISYMTYLSTSWTDVRTKSTTREPKDIMIEINS